MAVLRKARETMTAKERVRRTFEFAPTDRVPIAYQSNPGIHARLCAALGARDDEELNRALGVDYRPVYVPYVGRPLFGPIEGRVVDPLEGYVMRVVEHETGSYCDYCDFPLLSADEETIAGFPVPDPDDFDYTGVPAYVRRFAEYGLHVGNPGVGCVINCVGMLMGMEEALVRLYDEDEAVCTLVRRRTQSQLGILDRTLSAARGQVDFLWLGEDLGTQRCPMISAEMYRAVLRPIHRQFLELADSYRIPVMIHTCGSSSWAYEDFIEMGVRAVDTLQPEAANMSPAYLVEHFGGRLAFQGCISTAGAVAVGTPDDVVREVRETLAVMMPTRGYFFAPTHQLQDNTPTENAVAMYQAAHDYGVYR